MRFFFPDSQDQVDPTFDFDRERRKLDRVRQRDDLYAHELFSTPVCDGLLVSKGIVDAFGPSTTRYSIAQRQRLLREGAAKFFRTRLTDGRRLPVMGDCGAFAYIREEVPPFSVDEVLSFYVTCDFDLGISVDHLIPQYKPAWDDAQNDGEAQQAHERQALTLEYAQEFLSKHRSGGLRFEPLGVAQGWSPKSYAKAVEALQKMGYRYIALGGMVPLKTGEILASLEGVAEVRRPDVRLHLLGISRIEAVERFEAFGVHSLDSTSPLRQAFKDDKDNYYTPDRTYTAIRVPQVEGNNKLRKAIQAGRISQEEARRLERGSLEVLGRFDRGAADAEEVIAMVTAYERLLGVKRDNTEAYRELLADRPWKDCPCDVCRTLGHHVVMFRGAERNRRRGFHNLWVFFQRLQQLSGRGMSEARAMKADFQS